MDGKKKVVDEALRRCDLVEGIDFPRGLVLVLAGSSMMGTTQGEDSAYFLSLSFLSVTSFLVAWVCAFWFSGVQDTRRRVCCSRVGV